MHFIFWKKNVRMYLVGCHYISEILGKNSALVLPVIQSIFYMKQLILL